jgi:outer membrane protein assembly factor BamB
MNAKESSPQKTLRLWPGIVLVVLQWLARFVLPIIAPNALIPAMLGAIILGLLVIVWWVFFSRAPGRERWIAVALMILAFFGTAQILHKSIATTMMGLMFPVFAVPVLCLAFVAWAVASRHLTGKLRLITMTATILVACGFWALLRTNGMTGETNIYFAWRWSKTAEEKMMAQAAEKMPVIMPDSAITKIEAVWPGFRGANRDNIVHGVKITADWKKTPPAEMWRRPVGPACSSFAVLDNLLFTQEQRGEMELVSCYNLNTGKPAWLHGDTARFWDSHAGAGPRSTPTISNGRVYTLGATGILNVLDARTGSVVWSHNAAKDTEIKLPGWGFSSSPLVTDSLVIVAISGKLLAYDILSGRQRWTGPDGGDSYSSPHLLTIANVKQVLILSSKGVTSFSVADGRELWNYPLPGIMVQITQPAEINDNDILVSSGDTKGIRRLRVTNGNGGWTIEEIWSSDKIKPYFTDFVFDSGCVFGFDGPSLSCLDIETGNFRWRGGRYAGEIILLADQGLLLILSEKGELALVKATPDRFTELARIPAIKGRTWNHPVLVGDVVVVRNGEEMAAFRLPGEN